MKDVLVVRSIARPGRSAVHVDPVEASIVSGKWRAPAAGEVVTEARDGERRWEAAAADDQGVLKGSLTRGGYVYWPVRSDHDQILLLQASGHNCVYVNGEIRGGDLYGNGYVRLPVLLHSGTNEFLFQSGRGDLKVKLLAGSQPLSIHTADCTLPDIIEGEAEPLWGAAVLLNATTNFIRTSLRAVEGENNPEFVSIPPLGICKAPFQVKPPRTYSTNSWVVTLEASDPSQATHLPTRAEVTFRIRRPDQTYMRTFRSKIDDSIQYYAVYPASGPARAETAPALFLSLHGASVEARGQADAYSPKRWGPIVCPTNRRPYGFDWEEWGRWDAMEVLAHAMVVYHPDPRRIYLTGHSMGGHGTWQLGAIFPDRFAAIGPSAGWISFMSYANPNRPPATNALQKIIDRGGAVSDTLLMATNYLQEGVYILHGEADDNVPVREARKMREVLGGFHRDFDFFEQPGAGHWWDASDEPGADCVDWAPMFDFFARHVIPTDESVRRVRFVTLNPAVSSRSHWVTILAQQRQLEPSAVDLRCDPAKRRIVGDTTNVGRLWLEFPSMSPGRGLAVQIDGQTLENLEVPDPRGRSLNDALSAQRSAGLCLVLDDGRWRQGETPGDGLKRPERSGPFREAFQNHMAFVYATKGTPEENAWTLTKARYDAETFYYRGNASIEIMADVDLLSRNVPQSADEPHGRSNSRNLIVYGNAECNAAWPDLLGRSSIQVHRGRVRLGDREIEGDDLGCLFLQPNPNDPIALVGVVAGTGMSGMRVTERMPYFMSGGGFPDCLVIGAELPSVGTDGVRAAGFFGQDWQVGSGEFSWRER
jgi:poly(3-hydroxybutyrate) depolymerase